MTIEYRYQEAVEGFTTWFADQAKPDITYIAPGDSAAEMVRRMLMVAKKSKILLPAIQVLTHDQAGALYYEYDEALTNDLLSPHVYDKTIHFLDDYALTGEKLDLIKRNLGRDFKWSARFYVMIWNELASMSIGVYEYMKDKEMASSLNRKWDRRTRDTGVNRRSRWQ